MSTNATKRVCAAEGCRTILRTGRIGNYCSIHEDPRYEGVEDVPAPVPSPKEPKPEDRYRVPRNVYTRDFLVGVLQEFGRVNGRAPKKTDFAPGKPNHSTFINHFGSWSNAVEAAGFARPGVGSPRGARRMTSVRREALDQIEADGPLTSFELATARGWDRERASDVLYRLEKAGMVVATPVRAGRGAALRFSLPEEVA